MAGQIDLRPASLGFRHDDHLQANGWSKTYLSLPAT
jgi:hypothetical protein